MESQLFAEVKSVVTHKGFLCVTTLNATSRRVIFIPFSSSVNHRQA